MTGNSTMCVDTANESSSAGSKNAARLADRGIKVHQVASTAKLRERARRSRSSNKETTKERPITLDSPQPQAA